MYADFAEIRPHWGRSFAVSLVLHAALAAALLAGALWVAPATPPEPAPIRVQLLRLAEPAAAAPAVALPAAPPAAPVIVVPKPVVAKPKPVVAKPKPVPVRPTRPAPPPVAAEPLARSAPVEPAPTVDVAAAAPGAGAAATASPSAAGSPAGFASGRAAIGAGGDLDAYIAQVRELIRKHKRYPALARRRGIEGRLVLSLAIAADGGVAVTRTSGAASSLLEEGARAAVAAASPLPPPPAGALRLEVPVRFDLRE